MLLPMLVLILFAFLVRTRIALTAENNLCAESGSSFADIHFHYRRAIEAAKAGAACLRINPGNIGSAARVREVVQAARDHGCSMRIGVNAGSLEKHLLEKYAEPCPEALVESALEHAKILQDNDFHEFKISVKASDVFLAVAAYQQLAESIDCPLHIGIPRQVACVLVRLNLPLGLAIYYGPVLVIR